MIFKLFHVTLGTIQLLCPYCHSQHPFTHPSFSTPLSSPSAPVVTSPTHHLAHPSKNSWGLKQPRAATTDTPQPELGLQVQNRATNLGPSPLGEKAKLFSPADLGRWVERRSCSARQILRGTCSAGKQMCFGPNLGWVQHEEKPAQRGGRKDEVIADLYKPYVKYHS